MKKRKNSLLVTAIVLLAAILAVCAVACERAVIPEVPDIPSGGNDVQNAVKVSFYCDGFLYGIAVCAGKTLAMPVDPTKDGFSFVGWFYDEELTTPFIYEEFLEKEDKTDISLYAAWNKLPPSEGGEEPENPEEPEQPVDPEDPENPEEPQIKEYTVIFTLGGEIVSTQKIEEGKSAELPLPQYKAEENILYTLAVNGNYTAVTKDETVELSYLEADEADKGLFALGKATLLVKDGKLYLSDIEGDYPFDWIVIPSAAFGIFEIRGVKDGAFARVPQLTYVKLGDCCTEIEWQAFNDLILLEKVEFSEQNPEYSANGLFVTNKTGSTLIKYLGTDGGELFVTEGIARVADGAFEGSGFSKVTLPEGVTEIGARAFADSRSLCEIILPDSLEVVGESAFENCTSLAAATVPKNVNYIGNCAFAGTSALSSIYYEATELQATVSDNRIFDGAGEQNGIALFVADGVQTIPARLFDGAGDGNIYLDEISFGENPTLKKIGVRAFAETDIKELVIPSSVEVVEAKAFEDCKSLERTEYRAANAATQGISGTAFAGAGAQGSVFVIGKEVISVPDYLLFSLGKKVGFYRLDFEDGMLESIGMLAFAAVGFNGETAIPSTVAEIGDGAFSQTELNCISVAQGNAHYTSEDGVLYTSDMSVLKAYPACRDGVIYTVNVACEEISAYAFSGATGLEEIEFSCARVGDMAFYHCVTLASVKTGEGVEEIGTGAFSYCGALLSLQCPSTLLKISDNAFAYCGSLSDVTLNEGLKMLGSYAFAYCPSLGEVVLPSTLEDIGDGIFAK